MNQTTRNIVTLDIERIHPDPAQPRLVVDAELSASIKEQGVLQPISVELAQPIEAICEHCDTPFVELAALGDWMLNDGERRWKGAREAGLKAIDAEILPPSTEQARLVRQLTANTGKPLTAIEEALAYKALLDSGPLTQVELAKRLGKPRSLVGDRIRLVSLHPAWLELITSGKLQTSHAPVISIFGDVPAEYQVKAAAALIADYRAHQYIDHGDQIPVEEFRHLIYVAFRDYIKPLKDVPGYQGPVFSYRRNEYAGAEKFAADIAIWRPIWRKLEAKRTKEMRRATGSSGSSHRENSLRKQLLALPIDQRSSSDWQVVPRKGEVTLFTESGWEQGIDPRTFLRAVDQSKLSVVQGKHALGVVTSDLLAVEAARTVFEDGLRARLQPEFKRVRAEIEKVASRYSVAGPGLRFLIEDAETSYDRHLRIIAAALDIKVTLGADYHDDTSDARFDGISDTDLARMGAAYAASLAGDVKLPNVNSVRHAYQSKLRSLPFDLTPAVAAKPEPASKVAGRKRAKELQVDRPANLVSAPPAISDVNPTL